MLFIEFLNKEEDTVKTTTDKHDAMEQESLTTWARGSFMGLSYDLEKPGDSGSLPLQFEASTLMVPALSTWASLRYSPAT